MKPFRLNGDLPRLVCDGYQFGIDTTTYADGTVTIERRDFDAEVDPIILASFTGHDSKARALAEFERLCAHVLMREATNG